MYILALLFFLVEQVIQILCRIQRCGGFVLCGDGLIHSSGQLLVFLVGLPRLAGKTPCVGCCDNGVPVKGVHCINKILCSIVGWLLTCFYFHCENRQNQCKQKEQCHKNTYSLFHRSRHISSYFLCLLTIFRFIFGAFNAFVTGLVLADVLFNGCA